MDYGLMKNMKLQILCTQLLYSLSRYLNTKRIFGLRSKKGEFSFSFRKSVKYILEEITAFEGCTIDAK
jgi:hypothetical protein